MGIVMNGYDATCNVAGELACFRLGLEPALVASIKRLTDKIRVVEFSVVALVLVARNEATFLVLDVGSRNLCVGDGPRFGGMLAIPPPDGRDELSDKDETEDANRPRYIGAKGEVKQQNRLPPAAAAHNRQRFQLHDLGDLG